MTEVYQQTVARLEPDLAMIDEGAGWASVAISLRRIADALDRLSTPQGIETLVTDLRPLIEKLERE